MEYFLIWLAIGIPDLKHFKIGQWNMTVGILPK